MFISGVRRLILHAAPTHSTSSTLCSHGALQNGDAPLASLLKLKNISNGESNGTVNGKSDLCTGLYRKTLDPKPLNLMMMSALAVKELRLFGLPGLDTPQTSDKIRRGFDSSAPHRQSLIHTNPVNPNLQAFKPR